METCEIKDVTAPTGQGLQVSAENYISALSMRYAARGLVKSVHDGAEEQIRREEETRALAPDAYRLSTLSDAAVAGCYRRGKDTMSGADLVRYFGEMRSARIRNADFSGNTGLDECDGGNVKGESRALAAVTPRKNLPVLTGRIKALPTELGQKLPTWFNSEKPDSSKERKRFPLSAFAAAVAVAASLMLIVASSVMLTRAESNISRLQTKVSDASAEVAELRSDFEVQNDLLEIRRIAMEEYGMVEEDYLKMDYITLSSDDSVEVYEEEREESVGLSALLSAIGIKK